MICRSWRRDDFERVKELLDMIYFAAGELFSSSEKKGILKHCLIFEDDSNFGVFLTIPTEEFVVSYISFARDPEDREVRQRVWDYLREVMTSLKGKSFYVNVNSRNESFVRAVRDWGFRSDAYGYEFCFLAKNSIEYQLVPGLEIRGYEAEYLSQYLEVLDEAFNPLCAENGWLQNCYRNNQEDSKRDLILINERGDFGVLWSGEKLIGIYLLKGKTIQTVAINPVYQNQGYGSVLIRHCLKLMINQRKMNKVYLYVVRSNEGARRFYLRNGFINTGCYADHTYMLL